MLRSNFKISWRNLIKYKAHSIINITGLSVGMSVAMLIGLWMWDELSFDKYHRNYDRIAQVMEQKTMNGVINTNAAIAQPLADALRKNYGSDFKHIVMASWTGSHILAVDDKKVSYRGNFMGAEGPEMLTLNMLSGTRNGLSDRYSILISSTVANALFGNDEPVGQMIKMDNAEGFKVAGVYEDFPKNTSLRNLAFIAPWDAYVASHDWVKNSVNNWQETSFQMYVQLSENADLQKVSSKVKDIKLKNVNKEDARFKPAIILQPMRNWHLYSEFKNGINTGGAIEYVWMFGIIGAFVLLLACINFMNLSTARSEKRAKEVGIRKAIGSLRTQLMSQFFIESIFMAAMAFGISLLIVSFTLPFFNMLSGKDMSILWTNVYFWIISAVFILFTGTIAGTYPAIYLSSFNPVSVLKGTFKAGRSAAIPRKILVTIQFTVSVILAIGTIIVFKQIQFAKNRPVGYNRDGLIHLEMITEDIEKHFTAFETDLNASGAIAGITQASSPMTGINNNRSDLTWKEKDPNGTYEFANIRLTSGYGKTTGWKVLAGRDFSGHLLTDSSALILNEAAVKYMGLTNPLNEVIRVRKRDYTVVGIVKDMVMKSPYEPATPTIFYLSDGDFDETIIRINPSVSTHEAISKIGTVFKKYCPSIPFSYKFVDEDYARKFSKDERTGKLASVFAVLAIFVSCLGLFGMASFMAEQRTKEIGVRKVMGASVLNVWGLLSKEFVVLVLVALLIAIPVAYYFTHNWLQSYEYRTALSWWVFAAAGMGAILITLITVSFQAIKAAIANPVKSLRTE